MAAQTLDDLPTPALILDRAILRRNLKRMSERLRNAGVMLRPHLKTAKSIEVGRMAVEGHDGRITVSTLAEARYFADGGFTDILYGVGVVSSKLPAVAELRRRGVNLRVVTDNAAVAKAIADAAKNGDTFSVFIEIDSGGGRAGLPWPELPGLLEIARILHGTPGVELAGVMTHAGHSYHESTPDGIAAVAEQERQAIVGAAEKLRAAGIPCPIVSGGSTPTAIHSRDFTGITEMRPGVYVFNDLDQEFIGSCAPSDLALSVLASVSCRPSCRRSPTCAAAASTCASSLTISPWRARSPRPRRAATPSPSSSRSTAVPAVPAFPFLPCPACSTSPASCTRPPASSWPAS